MKRIPKSLIILLFAGTITGIAVAYYMYNKPHKNIDKAAPDFSIQATELYMSFKEDDSLASVNYTSKILEVTGTIDKINNKNDSTATILLAIQNEPFGNIKCAMDAKYLNRLSAYAPGNEVKLKGIFSGTNKMEEMGMSMLDIELTRCVIVE